MSKSNMMLRTRRRDNNVKPNRRDTRLSRLDRKSSRGMLYENEELRLRTININAEIERGQCDIKKLKRENEMLKREIWCLRDEYEKLDKLLKDKEYNFSSSSTTCSTSESETCSSCSEESDTEVETSQNLRNMKNLQGDFDHLSVVPEENSAENSEKNSERTSFPDDVIKPDQSYPQVYEKSQTLPNQQAPNPSNFQPLKTSKSEENFFKSEKVVRTNAKSFYQNMVLVPPNCLTPNDADASNQEEIPALPKTSSDLIANFGPSSRSTFSNGGNLEDLLNDIETISQDILKITTNDQQTSDNSQKPYKSELNVVLMPNPMPLLGFDKYKNIQSSFESLRSKSDEKLQQPQEKNPFFFGRFPDSSLDFSSRYDPDNFNKQDACNNANSGSKTNLLELTSSDLISSENEENLKFKAPKIEPQTPIAADNNQNQKTKSPKLSIRRKVSIHFKGKKDNTKKHSLFDIKFNNNDTSKKTSSLDSRKSTTDAEPKTPTSSGSDRKKSDSKQQRKSASVSPERKHVHVKDEKKRKKHKKSERGKNRRGTTASADRLNRERSFSVCTDRSLDHRLGALLYDEYGTSERERTNSLSSSETIKTRKMSSISNIPLNGKVPWCACWGNGCM